MHQYQDVQTGFSMVYLLLSLTSQVFSFQNGDLCTMFNGYTYYTKVGERGEISAGNASFPSAQNYTSHHPCTVELVTCPSCHIVVTFLHLHIPTCSRDASCRCGYVQVAEPSYDQARQQICGYGRDNITTNRIQTKTKVVSIRYVRHPALNLDSFILRFEVLKNVYMYHGGGDQATTNDTAIFETPYFPHNYPSDYASEYHFENSERSGCVQITFTDFQISEKSHVEFLDSNKSRIATYGGKTFRPPIITSSGPSLTVRFQANEDQIRPGFKATYSFLSDAEECRTLRPSTDCGGRIQNSGGVITLSKSSSAPNIQIYDCLWIIQPKFAISYETYLALRISQFKNMGKKSVLEVRQGLTSMSRLLYTARGYNQEAYGQEMIVSASAGYYLRLNGGFGNNSFLSIVYSTFTYNDCQFNREYRCKNGRCIKKELRCDGFNHCGDKSDESSCYAGTTATRDTSWWQSLSPKFYYPKQDSGGSTNPTTLILIASIAGFGMFVWTVATLLTKLQKKRQALNLREAVHTISGEVDAADRRSTPTSLPSYEPPPSYEEVIKAYSVPPPDYRTATRGMNRSGADNPAFVPDCPHNSDARHHHLPILRSILRNLTPHPPHPPPRPPPPASDSSRRTSKHSSLATSPNSTDTAECEVFVITPGSCKHNGACGCAYYHTPACSSTQDSRC